MVGTMKSDTRKAWTKQDAQDAARLLQGMAQRGKKAVEAVSSTQIEPGKVPVPVKEAGEASEHGVDTLKLLPPVVPVAHTGEEVAEGLEGESHSASAVRWEEIARRRLVLKADNDNRGRGTFYGDSTPPADAAVRRRVFE